MSDSKTRVFVVDSSEVWRKILINHIAGVDDLEVVGEINSGQGAILMLDELKPDIVMLEVSAKNSAAMVKFISNIHAIDPSVRLILCVDASRKQEILATFDVGIQDFITKPYKKQEVLRAIYRCLEEPIV